MAAAAVESASPAVDSMTSEERTLGEIEPVSHRVAPPVVMAYSSPTSGGSETTGVELSTKPTTYTTYYTMASPMTYTSAQPLVVPYSAPLVGVAQPIKAIETAVETSSLAQPIATYATAMETYTTMETSASQPMTTYRTPMPMNYTATPTPISYSASSESVAPSYMMGTTYSYLDYVNATWASPGATSTTAEQTVAQAQASTVATDSLVVNEATATVSATDAHGAVPAKPD